MQRVLAKERASQSKALDLQSQLNRAKSEQSQLKRSKEEVCEMSSLDSRSQRAHLFRVLVLWYKNVLKKTKKKTGKTQHVSVMPMWCHQGVWNSLQSSLSGNGDINTMFLAKLFMCGKRVYIPSLKFICDRKCNRKCYQSLH